MGFFWIMLVLLWLVVSLFGSSTGQVLPAKRVSSLLIESETILRLLQIQNRQGSCILKIVPSENTTITEFTSREQRQSLPDSVFHDAYVPVINQPEVTDIEPERLERDKLLARQLQRRLENTVTSHVRFIHCVSPIIFAKSALQNQVLRVRMTGQYVRQIDKHFFLGEEQVLEQVLRRPQVQKLRWPIGIIVRPPFTGVLCDGAPPSEKSHQNIPSANFAQVLFFSHPRLTKYTIHNLPSSFGSKVALDGREISSMCNSDTMAIVNSKRGGVKTEEYVGYVINLIVLASRFYNFSNSLTVIQIQETGPSSDLQWKPSQTMLTEETDVYLSSPIYVEKYAFASFSPVLDFTGILFFTSYPQAIVADHALLYPFSRLVWCLIGLSFLGFFLSFYLALRISTVPCLGGGSISSKLFQSFWLTYSIMLEQSYCTPSLQRSRTLQMLMILGLMGFLVTEIAYGSDLASYLTTPDFIPMPKTFPELAARGDVLVKFFHYFGTDVFLFRNTTSEVYGKIRDRYEYVASVHQCLIDALKTPTACLMYEETGLVRISRNFTLSRHNRSPLQQSKESALAVPISMMYPKFYKLSFEFDDIFGKFISTGHYVKWAKDFYDYYKTQSIRWIKEDGNREIYDLVCKSVKEKPPFQPLPFRIILSVWWPYIAGVIIASIAFLVEGLRYHFCKV